MQANNEYISIIERRKSSRHDLEFPVGLEFGSKEFVQSQSLDISATGLGLILEDEVGENREVQLTLCLDRDNVVEISGTTVRQRDLSTQQTLVGIDFSAKDQESLDKIASWLWKRGLAA